MGIDTCKNSRRELFQTKFQRYASILNVPPYLEIGMQITTHQSAHGFMIYCLIRLFPEAISRPTFHVERSRIKFNQVSNIHDLSNSLKSVFDVTDIIISFLAMTEEVCNCRKGPMWRPWSRHTHRRRLPFLTYPIITILRVDIWAARATIIHHRQLS